MRRYRTEIVIPTDRTVVIRLPERMPEGPATLIVLVDDDSAPSADPAEEAAGLDAVLEIDRGDIEWWDEFDEEADRAAEAGAIEVEPEAEGRPESPIESDGSARPGPTVSFGEPGDGSREKCTD